MSYMKNQLLDNLRQHQMQMTHYIQLGMELTKEFERKEFHGTLTGCRIVVPFMGHLYEILINPIAPIVKIEEEPPVAAPDGSV